MRRTVDSPIVAASFPYFLEHAQIVAAEDLADVGCASAALEQPDDDIAKLGARRESFEAERTVLRAARDLRVVPRRRPVRFRLAVEPIGGEACVIDADQVDHVVEMIEIVA